MWNKETRFKIRQNLPSNQIGEDYILLDTKATKTHELNEVAKFIWNELEVEKSLDQLITRLEESFETEKKILEEDTISFLNQLNSMDLITINE